MITVDVPVAMVYSPAVYVCMYDSLMLSNADETRALAEASVSVMPVTAVAAGTAATTASTDVSTDSNNAAKPGDSSNSTTSIDGSKLTLLKLSVKTVETFKQNISKRQHKNGATTAVDQLSTAELLRMSAQPPKPVTRTSSGYDQHGVYSGNSDSDSEHASSDNENDSAQQQFSSSHSSTAVHSSSVHSKHTVRRQQQQQQHSISTSTTKSSAISSNSSSSSSLALAGSAKGTHDSLAFPPIAVADSKSCRKLTATNVASAVASPENTTTAATSSTSSSGVAKPGWSWPIRRRKQR
jgi:hypothetical protein